MVNKSNKREPRHISNFANQKLESFFVQMLRREVLISQTLIGLFSLILQMIQKITFIELVEQQEEHKVLVKLFFSFMNMKLGS